MTFLSTIKQVTNDSLIAHFNQYGDIAECAIKIKPSGFKHAFIVFKTSEGARKAIANKRHRILKQNIVIYPIDMDTPFEMYDIGETLSEFSNSEGSVTASTNLTGTNLMDINDDCLIHILSYVDISDLCSLTETCVRLRHLANYIFSKRDKQSMRRAFIWDTLQEKRQVLVQFGHMITDLDICFTNNHSMCLEIDLVLQYSSNSLERLGLFCLKISQTMALRLQKLFANLKKIDMEYCKFLSSAKSINLFAGCAQLQSLKIQTVSDICCEVFGMTYPELTTLKLRQSSFGKEMNDTAIWLIIEHHPWLRTLHLRAFCLGCKLICEQIADRLTELENLCIIGRHDIWCSDQMTCLQRLTVLAKLKKLRLSCSYKSITPFLEESKSVNTLQTLEVHRTDADSAFYSILSKYKNIRKLGLVHVRFYIGLRGLLAMKQLTALMIRGIMPNCSESLIELVMKLPKLKRIILAKTSFVIDSATDQRLAEVVAQQPGRPTLEIRSDIKNSFVQNDENRKFVEYNELPTDHIYIEDDDYYDYTLEETQFYINGDYYSGILDSSEDEN